MGFSVCLDSTNLLSRPITKKSFKSKTTTKMTHNEGLKDGFDAIAQYYEDIIDHNNKILSEFTPIDLRDFWGLVDFCELNGKIEWVENKEGNEQMDDDRGIFTNVHIDQWSVGMEGDSFAGYIYTYVKGKWLQIPYYC
jgi:hypothetical protein